MPRLPKYTVNESYFWDINEPNKAYWLGVLAADGYIQQLDANKLRVVLELVSSDRLWIEQFLSDIQSNHPIVVRRRKGDSQRNFKDRESISVSITRYHFVLPILQMSIKTLAVFNFIPEDLLPHFIRGVFDGDGCISFEFGKATHTGYIAEQHRWILVSPDKLFLQHVNCILTKICQINEIQIRNAGSIYKLQIGGSQQVKRIKQYLYPSGNYSFLHRKYEKMPI